MKNRINIRFEREKNLNFQKGLSLVEIMVGIAIGLLVILVIMQVWSTFEDHKNRTASGSSAQESGLLALTLLEQDIRSAGAGIADSAVYDCTTIYSYYENAGTTVSPVPAYSNSAGLGMVPVQITDGGTGSDTITIKKGTDFLGSIPATITKQMPDFSSELNISSTAGFSEGDITLAIDSSSGNCVLFMVTQVQQAALKLQHNPGGTITYNPNVTTLKSWPGYPSGSKLIKIGQIESHVFTVNSSNQLIMTDYSNPLSSTTSVLAGDIVKLKAQYGVAAAGSQDVNEWVSATAATGWNTLDASEIKRIKAVRLVIVARSSKMEATEVTDSIDTVTSMAGLIDLTSDSNWKRYRYRVYQTIIPIRNVIWAGV